MRRKIRNKLFFIPVLFTMLLLQSCTEYKDVQVMKVVGAYPVNVGTDGLELEIAMKINNPNDYSITIVDSDLEIFLGKRKVGKTKLLKKVKLKKRSKGTYKFTIKGNYTDSDTGSLEDVFTIISERSLALRAMGSVKARAYWLVSKKVPVDFTKKVSL